MHPNRADGPFAQVAVLAQLGRAGGLFTYGIPAHLIAVVGPGSLVRVPFGRRMCQGVVCMVDASTQLPRVRDIEELLDPIPVVPPHGLALARWIASYYHAPLSDVLAAMLPPGLGRKSTATLQLGENAATARLTDDQRRVLDEVRRADSVEVRTLQRRLRHIDVDRAVRSLLRRRILVRVAGLASPRVSPRPVRHVVITEPGRALVQAPDALRRAPRQLEVLALVDSRGPAPLSVLTDISGSTRSALRSLEAKGLVAMYDGPEEPGTVSGTSASAEQPPSLSTAQRAAYEAIVRAAKVDRSDVFLLHGVTGSGKTEVYLRVIADAVSAGRQALLLVPEISLTPQASERVATRFPGRVAVLHSKLTAAERVEEWQRIRRGDVDVVVGARSALFAPLSRPAAIIVDEEHDPSYKQDASPRYHGRDAAAMLGRLAGATVILGSATPDIATYAAARAGKIHLLELPNRPVWASQTGSEPGSRPMPVVQVVDMRQELKSGNRGMFSTALLDALDGALAARQQALVFLNRRGTATVVVCRDCGFIARCPHCDIPLTYHSAGSRLICHRCDLRAAGPRTCPRCRSPRIRYLGVGTQRVEEEVRHLFPHARVLRWDRDAMSTKDAHEEILGRFGGHGADILVGTQMITKGLDFPLVTVVGVVSADTGLHLPDFRAPERSFQLLTQVAGRAGRATLPSRVIVQTYTPEHYAVRAAQKHDYHRFYRDEVAFRQTSHYPPFSRLARLTYSAASESECKRSAENLRQVLERAVKEEKLSGVELIGPAPCFVARIKNRYNWHLLVRAPAPDGRARIGRILEYVPAGWVIDVDPVDLL